jgi:NhaP-type Na+/H+ or K+/H+ antiporter
MNHGGQSSWERLLWWLIAAVIGLELLASVLPRLLVPLVVLAIVVIVVRLVWWYTQL